MTFFEDQIRQCQSILEKKRFKYFFLTDLCNFDKSTDYVISNLNVLNDKSYCLLLR